MLEFIGGQAGVLAAVLAAVLASQLNPGPT
jgi:hypothetical protein